MPRPKREPFPCSIEGCTNQGFRVDLCSKHYHEANSPPCTIDGCTRASIAGGLCAAHYRRVSRHGDVNKTAYIKGDDEARFWSYVQRGADDECWLWTGHLNGTGYGVINIGGKLKSVHRWAYEKYVGPIPDGLTLDHVWANGCKHRNCVNYVSHLEPVTLEENVMRGNGWGATHARKTHCIRGHEFTPENTWRTKNGHRQCRACRKVRGN